MDVKCTVPGSFICGVLRGTDDVAFTWLCGVSVFLLVLYFFTLVAAIFDPCSWWKRTKRVGGCLSLKREINPEEAYNSHSPYFQKFQSKNGTGDFFSTSTYRMLQSNLD